MNDNEVITMVIQIGNSGNSDDKLAQQQWSNYVSQMYSKIMMYAEEVHFSGGSQFDAPWQNACFVFEIGKSHCTGLSIELKSIRENFNQDSIALTQGETSFI
jgi:hypothetical protein